MRHFGEIQVSPVLPERSVRARALIQRNRMGKSRILIYKTAMQRYETMNLTLFTQCCDCHEIYKILHKPQGQLR